MAHNTDIKDLKTEIDTTRESRDKQLSKQRVPLHKQTALDYFDKDPNFQYRWVSDKYGRISSFKRAGWELVEGNIEDTFAGAGRTAEQQKNGQMWRVMNQNYAEAKDGALMRIPKHLFDEDQAEKTKLNDKEIEKVDPTGEIKRALNKGRGIFNPSNK